jgi:hypothetical protein
MRHLFGLDVQRVPCHRKYFFVVRYYQMTSCNYLKFQSWLALLICLSTAVPAQQVDQIDGYPTVKEALNKKTWLPNKSYYFIAKSSDTTVHLFWGNNTMKRMFAENLDFSAAEKLHVKWLNNEFLILQYGTGSGVWMDIVLPLNKKEEVKEFNNAVCFDSVYNLLGVEGYEDTILLVKNLITKKQQYIIDRQHKCERASNNSCIDSIAIKDKLLYLKWAVPGAFADNKNVYVKKIKLQL